MNNDSQPAASGQSNQPAGSTGSSRAANFLLLALAAIAIVAGFLCQPPPATLWPLLWQVGGLMVAIALLCFLVGEITGNFSQVDKLWSIVPVVYCWYLTVSIGLSNGFDPRMLLMACLVTLWGVRLTYNFSRVGGYSWKFWSGHEDYRWAYMRARPALRNPVVWRLFHLGFICLYQHFLLLLLALPILASWQSGQALGWPDYVLAVLFVLLIVWETVADQQQYRFQTEKHRRLDAGESLPDPYDKGFVTHGLWRLCRHPNYLAEQSIWVVFFLFGVTATGSWNWSVAGCALLVLLFRGSSNLSETICSGKYPAYGDYQRRVPRFMPNFFKQ